MIRRRPPANPVSDNGLADHVVAAKRPGIAAYVAAAATALFSAGVTALMLLINGSLVLVVMSAFSSAGPDWSHRPGFLQFVLFSAPLALAVLQWMLWDLISGFLSRRRDDASEQVDTDPA